MAKERPTSPIAIFREKKCGLIRKKGVQMGKNKRLSFLKCKGLTGKKRRGTIEVTRRSQAV